MNTNNMEEKEMEKEIFRDGLDILEAVKNMDIELKKGNNAALSPYFDKIKKIKDRIVCCNEPDELIFNFLGEIVNLLIVVNPSNRMLTDRMYQFNMIHAFMELFGDHESVGENALISDKNVRLFIESNGERDTEILLNILSQAGEVLSRKNKDLLKDGIYRHLSELSSATLFFAVTNGIVSIDDRIIGRLEELCYMSGSEEKSSCILFNPAYAIVKLRLYGYLDPTRVKNHRFQSLVDECWAFMTS